MSGRARSDLESSCASVTRTDSSPRLVVITVPADAHPVAAVPLGDVLEALVAEVLWLTKSWTVPVWSCRSANTSWPWRRRSMIRPATRTVSPVSAPGSSEGYFSRISPIVWSRSNLTG